MLGTVPGLVALGTVPGPTPGEVAFGVVPGTCPGEVAFGVVNGTCPGDVAFGVVPGTVPGVNPGVVYGLEPSAPFPRTVMYALPYGRVTFPGEVNWKTPFPLALQVVSASNLCVMEVSNS